MLGDKSCSEEDLLDRCFTEVDQGSHCLSIGHRQENRVGFVQNDAYDRFAFDKPRRSERMWRALNETYSHLRLILVHIVAYHYD